jgi:D-glycero-D-manno-heptose 1,7-bisphosphate phosphatase
MKKKAVFIGLGNALVQQHQMGEQRLLVRSAARAFPLLHQAGYELVVIAHEPDVALGIASEEQVRARGLRLRSAIERLDGGLIGFYYCPHDPQGNISEYAVDCTCRRPQPGLIIRAASDLEIDLAQSWVIGDLLDDVEAARRAGCRAVLVDTGSETEWRVSRYRVPNYLTGDLAKAARLILASDRRAIQSVQRQRQTW